jgi:heme-degrading monooxygenase HmoA
MAIVRIQDTPTEAGMEMYDEVNRRAGVVENPPEGLIVHTASRTDEGMLIVDVWESQEAFDRFAEERLNPVIRELMGDNPGGHTTVRTHEVHSVVRPGG